MIPELEALISSSLAAEAWMQEAACANENPEYWFPTPGDHKLTKHAVAICKTCPVRARCLEFALKTDSAYGIWGATTEAQRRQIKENGDAA